MRSCGVLLHPTSLPSPYGIGDLGRSAYRFVDWLAEAGQDYWQILPLGPVDENGSPYKSASAFAGNELLISPDVLADWGLVTRGDVEDLCPPDFAEDGPVDFPAVRRRKTALLDRAYSVFAERGDADLREDFAAFCRGKARWLYSYARYCALSDLHDGLPWNRWDRKYAPPGNDAAIVSYDDVRHGLPQEIRPAFEKHCFRQYLFFRQWDELHRYARTKGVSIFGDIPIYVAYDSADVWAHPRYFLLDEDGSPLEVAGVPPDYFNATGQLWGNPVYRWDALREDDYRWWIDRLRAVFDLVDLARIDHFRGLEAFWSVPAWHTTAEHGRWIPGPGEELLRRLSVEWSGPWNLRADGRKSLPIVAEDLGHITPPVIALRKQFGLPGMAVLQFAFGTSQVDAFLPDRVDPDTVMYSGTHDNDTSRGWFQREVLPRPHLLERLSRYCRPSPESIHWSMIELAFRSRSEIAVVPLQDVLGLDSDARMNTPGTPHNNWRWRFDGTQLTDTLAERLRRVSAEAVTV